ncbi:hypothetical protein A2837_00200 [Candidatus Kaiserbacteria bacterium RIFCSPHIGHO2_01_FULL_46_22]|uniref:TNase-like domain-containing protein n=1 Tax=Candidatus Kaiserbacteria bacterium RIFCSPHIGHO2_01_FULL_46_22 TaxID=1798475 RepID=A0A1F6BXH0_9BACT|nr:MAG: hypothetical protein A2837_00200 [Candidatus Kaiserbacteria bacterium RIFCSPHIGHO2_01_FULL_46_22]
MYRIFLYILVLITFIYIGWSNVVSDENVTPADEVISEQVITASSSLTQSSGDQALPQESLTDSYEVLKVIDGDTIVVNKNGISETIRMIGVDTPETVHPSKAVQCFGVEASSQTKSWLVGQSVRLEIDSSQGERDKYGRMLAYVFRADGLFINQELIAKGFAYEYTYNLPYKYQAEFKAAEEKARTDKQGLWAESACAGDSEVSRVPQNTPTYPADHSDKDCADFATQAAAQSYFEANGGSSTYNYDRLDSDADGTACESLP